MTPPALSVIRKHAGPTVSNTNASPAAVLLKMFRNENKNTIKELFCAAGFSIMMNTTFLDVGSSTNGKSTRGFPYNQTRPSTPRGRWQNQK
jgi:hypothetical protein